MLRAAVLLFAASVSLVAQEFRGSILGRVTDSSGAVVVGATIRITNTGTNAVVRTTSNEEGNYQAPFLLPGDYRVEVEHPGFKKMERTSVRVSLNTPVTIDVGLELGAAAETVTVSASAPLLTTAAADLGQVVDRNYVDTINVSLSRNAVNVGLLAPGVTGSTGSYTSNAQSTVSITGGGSTRGRNEYLLDGIPNTVPASGGLLVYVPSLDSVEEVKVQTTLFDAAYGHSNGGAISITTRSGTNQPHGSVYTFRRWRALNANTWNNNRAGAERAPVSYKQWGFTVGGPVYVPKLYDGRNRTFFSATVERDRDARDLFRQARVPTAAERTGDFSQTLNQAGAPLQIYDPSTTAVSGGAATRQAFAGARVPANRIDPTGAAVLAAMPLPTVAGVNRLGQVNWSQTGVYTVEQRQWSTRIDQTLSDKQRLFGRFSRMRREQLADTFFTGAFAFPANGGTDLGLNARTFTSAALDDTVTFSPTLLASFRYGFARRLSDVTNGAVDTDPAALKVSPGISANQALRGYPVFAFANAENLPSIGSSLAKSANDQHAALATFTKLSGRHSIKFGVDYRLLRWNDLNPGAAAPGTFNLSAQFTSANPSNPASRDTTGTGMASLLLGLADSGSIGYATPLSLQSHYWGFFIQEDWKVSPTLTLNFGVRYELETPYTERYNRVAYGFDYGAKLPINVPGYDVRGGILFAGQNGVSRREGELDKNNLGPRFGFAYQAMPKLVVRGGYGLFFSSQPAQSTFLGRVGSFDTVTQFVGSTDNGLTPFTNLQNPFPNGVQTAPGAAAGLLAQAGDSLTFYDQNRVAPYNQQWQFSIQRELPGQLLVEGAYVGMLALKQFESFNLNEKPDRYLAEGAAENTRVPNPFFGILPPTSTIGASNTIAQSRLWPGYPQFATLTVQGANTGRSVYHALQARVDKRLTRGLAVLWTYTWSKNIDNNTTSLVNPRNYRTVSEFDQAHVMRIAFNYKLPIHFSGSTAKRIADMAFGGWQVSGLAQFATGLPLQVTHNNGRPVRLRNATTPGSVHDRLGDQREGNRIVNPYIDPAAFAALPTPYIVSPTPPYLPELRAPGQKTLNAAVLKDIPLRADGPMKLQLRLEGVNVTNTPNFDPPTANLSQLAQFGVITSATGNREMQAALKFIF